MILAIEMFCWLEPVSNSRSPSILIELLFLLSIADCQNLEKVPMRYLYAVRST
jgi:N-acetylmuramoyl-L-alanine amidase